MLHDILVEITEFLTASRGCLKCDTNIGDSVTFDLGLAEFDLIYSTKKKKKIDLEVLLQGAVSRYSKLLNFH